ncbi:transcription antitermination factor NusB [Clostridium sp. WILCCON 0269]|uniref:Transcription antitermination protein NusB n=1 Tax=Candidatus Clostridium eludens TaxID=3381663 RepID=A0ABW8SLI6_9CLOT
MNRKKTRELTMKLLFQMAINKEEIDVIIANLKENIQAEQGNDVNNNTAHIYGENAGELKDVDIDYVVRVLKGIEQNEDVLNREIEKYLRNWKLNRLSKIDAAILKICTYEFLYEDDIPEKVSINEAIELAKKYSSEKSAPFINGVLGNMIKDEKIKKK